MDELSTEISDVKLTEEERKAWEEWKKLDETPMPLYVAIKLYELFLNFYTCEEIYRINAQRAHLGKILDARLRFQWDKRRAEQLETLHSSIESKVLRVKNEAVVHLTDLLAASHKTWGDKLKIYLAEGDPSILGDLNLTSFKHYKEIIDLLKTLTDKKDAPTKSIEVGGITVNNLHAEESRRLTSGAASDLLHFLDAKEINKVKS